MPEHEHTAVYQAFNAADELLYVGIASNWARRWTHHASQSAFFPDVANIFVEYFPSRADALQREAFLIRSEHPQFNVRGRTGPAAHDPYGETL